MLVRTSAFYTPQLLRANPNFLFVFGDNLQRIGKGGQALVRDEPNAVGLATKRAPNNHEYAFFDNLAFSDFYEMKKDIELVKALAAYKMVVIPFSTHLELGTGLAELPTRAPALYKLLQEAFTADMPRAALRLPIPNPIEIVCDMCGSSDIVKDAWAAWDIDAQDWELSSVFDDNFCQNCEESTHGEERLIHPERQSNDPGK